jgi:hypothetical protein
MRIATAVGAFCALLGAMMLIVPHRFETATYATLHPHLLWWGVAFLLAGGGLLTAAVAPLRWLAIATHFAAGGVLLTLAHGFAAGGMWGRMADYMVLGLGTALAPLLPQRGQVEMADASRDLLALLIGLGIAVTALMLIAHPVQFDVPFYAMIWSHLHWYVPLFVAAGLGLAYAHLGPACPRAVLWALHLIAAATLLVFAGMSALRTADWAGIAYYAGFGALVAILPWLEPALRRINPSSLRIRLALVLIVAAAAPLIIAVTIVTDRAEQSATGQALTLQQTIAVTLADDTSHFLSFHRAGAEGAATAINLARMTSGEQGVLLRRLSEEYQDVSSLGTYDAVGSLVARGDSPPPAVIRGSAVFEQARRTNTTSFAYQVLPPSHRLLFEFGVPLRRPDNAWAGLLLFSVESTEVASDIRRVSTEVGSQAYVVNDEGRLVAHQDAALNGSFQYVADSPPVAAMHLGNSAAGVLKYWSADGQQLAGFAHVAGAGLGVVVERPIAVALAGMHAGREIAFTILMLMVSGAAVGGTIAAGALARPLEALAREATRLGDDNVPVALPSSGIAEVGDLSPPSARCAPG